jgi:hypothetical protein
MSDLLKAKIDNQKFYILPVCNIPDIPTAPDVTDQTWIEWTSRGYSTSTTTGGLSAQYNDNIETYIIPDYIKKLDIDYISFGVTANGSVANPLNNESYIITCNLIYELVNGINPFYDGIGSSFNFAEDNLYRTQIKVPNGKLIPIDLKSVYAIEDIAYLLNEDLPAPTSSPDKNNKARPYNITLWKKFFKSTANNRFSFIADGKLPVGLNAYINPDYTG